MSLTPHLSPLAPRCLQPSPREASRQVGDPVDVVSGAVVDRMRDFRIEGPAPIEWWRYYDSRRCDEDCGLGLGHRHAFDHRLTVDLEGLTYAHPDGSDAAFSYDALETGPAIDNGYTLTGHAGETYFVRRHAEPTLEFHLARGDAHARLVAVHHVDAAGTTQHVQLRHDRHGRLSRLIAPGDVTLLLTWNEVGHLVDVSRPTADASPESLIGYEYTGRLLTAGIDAYDQRFTFRYHADGRLASRTDRRGFTFHWEFDQAGRCLRSYGDDGLLAVTLTYAPLEGRTTVVDAHGGAWTYEYLPDGVITSIVDPYGGRRRFEVEGASLVAEYDELGARTSYRFDDTGAPIAKITPDGDAVRLPAGAESDPRAHHVSSHPLAWELGDFARAEAHLPAGDELAARLPAAVHALLTTSDDPRRGHARQIRDAQGLLFHEEIEDGGSRSYGYTPDGGIRRVTDHDGSVWRLEHTSWNHVSREVDPLGHEARYEYSCTERVTAAVDAAGVRSEYVYDRLDRLIAVSRGGALRERYVYDPAGHVTETRDGDDVVRLAMRYDAHGHLLTRTLASGGTQTFDYDAEGRCAAARTGEHVCTLAHDLAGRRLHDLRDGAGVAHRFGHEGLAETTVLARFRTRYRRDVNGDLVLVDPTGASHRLIAHGAGVYTKAFADGFSETVQFHPRTGRVLGKALWSARRPALSWSRRYQYSGEGDLLTSHDSDRGATRYRYDAAHRLVETAAQDEPAERYEYTSSGTLYRAPGLDGRPGALNRLEEANGERFVYDDRHHVAGRVRASGQWRYQRDSRDQLVRAEWSDDRGLHRDWTAEYDAFARRVRTRSAAHGETRYYWDTDRLAAEVFGDGRVRVYVYPDLGAMTPLLYVEYASVEAAPESGTRRYVLTDQRGCPERILDPAGAVVWQARVDPYGRAHVEIGADLHQPLRFPGHWYDADTGLHYNRFRYYDPECARYLESDPIGLGGGLNVYAYTANPLVDVDVLGLNCASVIHVRDEPDGSRTILAIAPIVGTGPGYRPRITEHWHRPGSRTIILGGEPMGPGRYRGGIVVEELDRTLPSGDVVRMRLVSNDADLIRVANHHGDEVGGLRAMRADPSEGWRSDHPDLRMRLETQPAGHAPLPNSGWDGEGPHVAVLRPEHGSESGRDGWRHDEKYFIRDREGYANGRNRLHDPEGVFNTVE